MRSYTIYSATGHIKVQFDQHVQAGGRRRQENPSGEPPGLIE
mgnify:CR=1 FL=1